MKPVYNSPDGGGVWCKPCQRRKPESEFFASDLRIKRRRCRSCAMKYAASRPPPPAMQRIMDRCRQTERRRYGRLMPGFRMDDLRAILRRHGANVALCPQMSVRRRNPTRPLSVRNSVVEVNGAPRGRPRKCACVNV